MKIIGLHGDDWNAGSQDLFNLLPVMHDFAHEQLHPPKFIENSHRYQKINHIFQSYTHRIHVWYICLHVVDFYDKCRQISHTWIPRDIFFCKNHHCWYPFLRWISGTYVVAHVPTPFPRHRCFCYPGGTTGPKFARINTGLGGGNSNIFYFHPEAWGNDPIWRAYFQRGWFNHQLEVRRFSKEHFLFGPKVSLGKKSAEGTRWAKYDRF